MDLVCRGDSQYVEPVYVVFRILKEFFIFILRQLEKNYLRPLGADCFPNLQNLNSLLQLYPLRRWRRVLYFLACHPAFLGGQEQDTENH